MILARDPVDHGQYLVEHVLAMCNAVSGGASCASEQGECPETGLLLGQGWSPGHSDGQSEASMGQAWANEKAEQSLGTAGVTRH